jgi:Leucine-rich repeat (LRR) protein
LIVDENEIAVIEFFGSRTLHTLSINKNKLTSFEGLTSHS